MMPDTLPKGPLVDVIIPVHSAARPIRRAAASVLHHSTAPVRVTVVAHNIDPKIISVNLGDLADDPRLRIAELSDGIHSPAGPLNRALDRVTAPFFAFLGSDDEFAPGAVDAWLQLQEKTGASVVIAAIQLVNGRRDPYPPTRNGRRVRDLDARKDRLHYRSAPLGLISSARHGHLRFTEGMSSGEDLSYSCSLWLTGVRIAYGLTLPPYVGHDDAEDRVTDARRAVTSDFRFLDAIEEVREYRTSSAADRCAIVIKILRLHFFDAMRAATRWPESFPESRRELLAVFERLQTMSPEATALLSWADHRAIAALRDEAAGTQRIAELVARRQNYLTPGAVIPRQPLRMLDRQAPLRTLLAGVNSLRAR